MVAFDMSRLRKIIRNLTDIDYVFYLATATETRLRAWMYLAILLLFWWYLQGGLIGYHTPRLRSHGPAGEFTSIGGEPWQKYIPHMIVAVVVAFWYIRPRTRADFELSTQIVAALLLSLFLFAVLASFFQMSQAY